MEIKKMTKRARQAIATKNTIYNAAIELMDAKGFENITVSDISEKAGVSVGSFYHYFESKHSILAEIFHKGDEYFLEHVDGNLEADDSRGQIVEYFQHYARFIVLNTIDMTKQLFTPKVTFFTVKGRPMQTLLEKIVKKGLDSGDLICEKSADEMVHLFFVLARGIVFDWSLNDGNFDLETTMTDYMRILVGAFA